MLVLSRKVGEKVVVPGCDMLIEVIQVRPGVVRLGFVAPEEIVVDREEVWTRRLRDGIASNIRQEPIVEQVTQRPR